jgi:hypothetical protein
MPSQVCLVYGLNNLCAELCTAVGMYVKNCNMCACVCLSVRVYVCNKLAVLGRVTFTMPQSSKVLHSS